jgi:arginine deiminase
MFKIIKKLYKDKSIKFPKIKPIQSHENGKAKIILVHEPGTEALLGSIHFTGSLFEKPVNIELAKKNHQNFRKHMEERGITVLTVRDILSNNCDKNVKERIELEELAVKSKTFI